MKYIENEMIELKSILTEDTKTEIVAFLNSYLGGTIYIGVDNLGNIVKLSQKEKDLYESKIINWIRDEAIYPNCSEFINLFYNEDNVLSISIIPGNNKPYYLKDKGPKPSGVYVRYGRNKSQATHEEITRMIMNSNNVFYEELPSNLQKLTFNTLKLKFEEKNIEFNNFKMITSKFIINNKYTNLAFIFSDQYDVETKIGVYIGLDRETFKSKKEFRGSIIKQIDKTLEYCDLCNETRVIIDGSPTRKEYVSYYDKALREAILNCFCHRDYTKRSNIKIEFFDNRCEIISPGGFYAGLTLEEALCGVQSFRNKYLVQLLHKLGYIENYSSGLNRIIKQYQNENSKPVIETSLNMFKVIFPNLTYNFDQISIDTLTNNYRNVADVLNDVPNVPNHVPDKCENVPDNVTDVPNSVPDVPNDVPDKCENVLDNVPNVPNSVPNVPNHVPDKCENVPDNVLDVPNSVPNKCENVPDNVLDVPNGVPNVPNDVPDEIKIIKAIKKNKNISRKELAKIIKKSSKTVSRILKNSKSIIRIGSTKSGYWKIIETKEKNGK